MGLPSVLKYCLLFFACILLPETVCLAQTAFPANEQGQYIIDKIDLTHLANDASNYAITQDKYGNLYFGNSSSAFKFDGDRLKLITATFNKYPRSLAFADNDRVFMGSSGEFGYLAVNESGLQTFHNLTPLVSSKVSNIGNITYIMVRDEGVYFRSSRYVYFWRQQQDMEILPADGGHFKRMFVVDDKLIVQRKSLGLFTLDNGVLSPLPKGEFFKDKAVASVLKVDDKMLVVTQKSGVFVDDGQQFVPWTLKGQARVILKNNRI